ncbi:type 11 methyltransferase [Halorubrum coriense DSM 10284]|uniref:Type 11 methyltransferase n=1 Tax=Halorubrum coriense DSM 10284 TaxID=1227466 RepID=M0EA78_9EURY|nr:class I SAM-dependent methyltransferase [Halorubrum coriense]ELZ43319.1 type 11 methyltransferase [Halorubrum coriense DSM 10284]
MADQSETEDEADWWNEVYESETVPPWDIAHPQPALVDAIESYGLSDPVLDVGCGTGTHALWATERGHTALGIDFSEVGIEVAQKKARKRSLNADFRVADALNLPSNLGPFKAVLDSGLLHAFEADERKTYARELAAVVSSGGHLFLVGFAEGATENAGPNPLTHEDIHSTFGSEWTVHEIQERVFETRVRSEPGLLAVVERI